MGILFRTLDQSGSGVRPRLAGRLDRILEIGPGGRVGIQVVVYIFGPFIGGDHVEDIIVPGPLQTLLAQKSAVACSSGQPFSLSQVTSRVITVIVPGRDAHIRGDMVFERSAEWPYTWEFSVKCWRRSPRGTWRPCRAMAGGIVKRGGAGVESDIPSVMPPSLVEEEGGLGTSRSPYPRMCDRYSRDR